MNPVLHIFPEKGKGKGANSFSTREYLARPIFAVKVADDTFAGLDDGEEVLLVVDLGVFAVAEADPTAPLLRHSLHLLQPPLPQRLNIVRIHPIQGRDLVIDLVLHRLRYRKHLLLQYLYK